MTLGRNRPTATAATSPSASPIARRAIPCRSTVHDAWAEPDGTVRSVGVIPNRPESIRKLVKRLGSPEQLRACYEAGPTGYAIYWQLTALGVRCEVVAPILVPVKCSCPLNSLRVPGNIPNSGRR